jgi:hypothetical protein
MWRRCAQQQQRNERLASQHAKHARQDLLAGVMSLWLQCALTKQRAKAIVARCQSRHANQLLQHGFQAFQVVTEVRKARAQLVQGMLVRVQVSLCYLLICCLLSDTWTSWYDTWLVIELTPKDVVFSFLFVSVLSHDCMVL